MNGQNSKRDWTITLTNLTQTEAEGFKDDAAFALQQYGGTATGLLPVPATKWEFIRDALERLWWAVWYG